MAKARIESPWMVDVLLALGARPDIVLWRQMTGIMCPPSKPNVFLHVAPDGMPDILGFQIRRHEVTETVNPESFQPVERTVNRFYAQFFGIETKHEATGKQADNQRQWEKIFRAHYGIYLLAPAERWDLVWAAFGQEPDPICAEEAERLREELGITGGPVGQDEPVQRARRRARR